MPPQYGLPATRGLLALSVVTPAEMRIRRSTVLPFKGTVVIAPDCKILPTVAFSEFTTGADAVTSIVWFTEPGERTTFTRTERLASNTTSLVRLGLNPISSALTE